MTTTTKNSGPYSRVGPKGVPLGYAMIPIMPHTKRPGERRGGEYIGMMNWRAEYTERLPTKFEIDKWSDSDAGVCVVCGKASRDLVAVDIDIDDTVIQGAILKAIPASPVIKTGAKGQTLFFRGSKIEKSKSWNIPYGTQSNFRACDLLGPGRQTVLPPTIHPDTKQPYVWITEKALEDVRPEDLPELTPEHVEAIGKALEEYGYDNGQQSDDRPPDEGHRRFDSLTDDSDTPEFRRLNNAAMDNFDAWVPKLGLRRVRRISTGYEAVAEWRASSSGQDFSKRKYNLKFHREGIVDFGDGPRRYTPINVVINALDMGSENDTAAMSHAYSWLSDALGWNSGDVIELAVTSSPTLLGPVPGDENPLEEATALVVPVAAQAYKDDEEAYHAQLEALTHCPGLVGSIVDWITDTAQRPNRVLALGVALTVIGTLVGRRVAGPTGSATHLYVMELAPTAAGKQHPMDCLNALMLAAGARDHIGASQFMSFQAVVGMLVNQPLSLNAMDEFGAFLGRINHRNAGSHERGISGILRSIWGTSFALYTTPEWAGRRREMVFAPALSIYGVSTPDEFFDSLQSSDAKNGFLNRFLVVNAMRTEAVTPKLPRGKVPDNISGPLQEIYTWGGGHATLANSRMNDPTCMPEPVILNWSTAKAKDCFTELQKLIEKKIIDTEFSEHYIGRTAEIAVRLATIRAIGRNGAGGDGPTVDLSDMQWGRDLALLCGERLAKDGAAYVADNEQQQWSHRILAIVRSKGVATARDVQRSLRCALISQKVKEYLESLSDAGLVEAAKLPMKGGKMVKAYKYVGED